MLDKNMVPTSDYGDAFSVDLGNNNALTVKTYDPHGFWKFSILKGRLPEYMKGQYTSLSEVSKDVTRYLADKAPAKE